METQEFDQYGFRSYHTQTLIVVKGLPCTAKTDVAMQIGKWAKCPVLSIDDLLEDEDATAIGSNINNWEEVHSPPFQRAFASLCRLAKFHLYNNLSKAVVIKSRFCSTFDLQHLCLQLNPRKSHCLVVLIIECEMRNKHHWKKQFEKYPKKWYRPNSWIDVESSKSDWDLDFLYFVKEACASRDDLKVRRLVVDPFTDLGLLLNNELAKQNNELFKVLYKPNPIFWHTIYDLIRRDWNGQDPYRVEFDEYRVSRGNQFLNAPILSERSEGFCGGGCLFKYFEEFNGCWCELCDEEVVNSSAYTCHFCILTFHESCVDLITIDSSKQVLIEYVDIWGYIRALTDDEKHACKACFDEGKEFGEHCPSCLFLTIVKQWVLPPVVRHDHHPHSLFSLTLLKHFVCKACSKPAGYGWSYVCKACEWYYHPQCLFMPREFEHEHGGHEHVLKLKYTQDDMEREDYWCDVCYEDLDPYFWFYSCKTCPYYASHFKCAGVLPHKVWDY